MTSGIKIITENRKARFDYHIDERIEAGIVLTGSEVKSLRAGKANLVDAFATIRNGEAWLHKAHISHYQPASLLNHDPTRPRKLLLHHQQLESLIGTLKQKGSTLVPLSLYFKNGRAKVELGLCRGKKHFDKREGIKKRETTREMSRALRRNR